MGRAGARRGAGGVALLAAALLAGCTVEVEGAPCRAPGDPADCPGGQACGNDLRCSVRALACASAAAAQPYAAGSMCTPGVDGGCLDASGAVTTATGALQAKRCTGDDPVCGTWVVDPCPDQGLACDRRAPAGGPVGPWCVCPTLPPRSPELFVRPGGSPAAEPPFATGAAAPAQCSFSRLGEALAVADPSGVATVTAVGAGTDPATATTVTFSRATGETFPLVVKRGVTLRSDAPAGGGTYQLVFDGDGLPSAPALLHSGAALSGFTIRNGTGGGSSDAVALTCDAADPILLSSVVLDGTATLGRGLAAGASCNVVARDLTVRNMAGAGLSVDAAADPAPVVSVTRGTVSGCGDGVFVRRGRAVLQSVRIEGNAGMGVRVNDLLDPVAARIEIRNSKVVGNGNTGIIVGNATEVRITGTTSFGNGATTAWGGSPFSTTRNAGGVVLFGNPPAGAVEFARNRIYKNGGDQLLVLAAGTQWTLDGVCGSDASGPLYTKIGCYDSTTYRGIVAVNANVSARYFGWEVPLPGASDVSAFSGAVDLGTPIRDFLCPQATGLCTEAP